MAPLLGCETGVGRGITLVGSATSTRGFIVRQPLSAAQQAGRKRDPDHSCPSRCSIWSVVWIALELSS